MLADSAEHAKPLGDGTREDRGENGEGDKASLPGIGLEMDSPALFSSLEVELHAASFAAAYLDRHVAASI